MGRSEDPESETVRNRRPAHPLFPSLVALALLVAAPAPGARGEDEGLPYPPGRSTHTIEGLETVLVLPEDLSAQQPASLLIVLHGAGGKAANMALSFAPWAADGYVVCATQAPDLTWEPADLDATLRIAAHLKEALPIDPEKVHVVGYSNGGWNLTPLAFDDDLRPCSATWIAAGFRGGSVPRWAKSHLGAIALAGGEDPNLRAAKATVPALRDDVRSVEVQVQPDLGHAFPRDLMPYLQWWMGVQEGRFTPGRDLSFDWTEDLDGAIASQEGKRRGGVMVWVYGQDDAEKPEARELQHEVFFDPEVRFLGRQIPCVRLEAAAHADLLERLEVEAVPALVVLDRKGEVKKVYEERFKTSRIARTLRRVAPERRMPRDD